MVSGHVRARSVSFRSIRGLYIRKGNVIVRAHRIRFKWGPPGISFEGLHVQLGEDHLLASDDEPKSRAFALSVFEFAPRPFLRRSISIVAMLFKLLGPFLSPLFRPLKTLVLRLALQRLPAFVKQLELTASNVSIGTKQALGSTSTIEHIRLALTLDLSEAQAANIPPTESDTPHSYGSGFRRHLSLYSAPMHRLLGDKSASASASLTVNQISGTSDYMDENGNCEFLNAPGPLVVDLGGTLSRGGIIEEKSVTCKVHLGTSTVDASLLLVVLGSLKAVVEDNTTHFPLPASPAPDATLPQRSRFQRARDSRLFQVLSPRHQRQFSRYQVSKEKTKIASDPARYLPLRILSSVRFTLDSCEARVEGHSLPSSTSSFFVIARDLEISITPSSHEEGSLLRRWRGVASKDISLETTSASVTVNLRQLTIESRTRRESTVSTTLVTVLPISVRGLACDWPSFIPTASAATNSTVPVGVLELEMGGVDVTADVELLQSLLVTAGALSETDKPPHARQSPTTHPTSSRCPSLPTLDVKIACGAIRTHLTCGRDSIQGGLGLQLYSAGFNIMGTSQLLHHAFRPKHVQLDAHQQPLQLSLEAHVTVHPFFTRVGSWQREDMSNWGPEDPKFMSRPPILTTESVEIALSCTIMAISDDLEQCFTLDLLSALYDICTSCDAICLELWHTDALRLAQTLSDCLLSPKNKQRDFAPPSTHVMDRLPTGASIHLGIGRLVVFVTAPEINPMKDSGEMTRGLAFRSSLSVQYARMLPQHVHYVRGTPVTAQTRHKLSLPEDCMVVAVSNARSSIGPSTSRSPAFARLACTSVNIRSALATEFEQDDPLVAEKDGPGFTNVDFLSVSNFVVNVKLEDGRNGSHGSLAHLTIMDARVDVLSTVVRLQMVDVYSALLAINLLTSLRPRPHQKSPQPRASLFKARFDYFLKKVRVIVLLPHHDVWMKIDSARGTSGGGGDSALRLGWKTVVLWASVPPANRWDADRRRRWKEITRLQSWDITVSSGNQVMATGDNARIRLPTGFIMAHLIKDIGVMVKGSRHLVHLVKEGQYRGMDLPSAVKPRVPPSVQLQVRRISLEASDDDLESQLGLIWRAGFHANRERLDREEGFSAKVSAILASGLPNDVVKPNHSNEQYQFDAKHSVSFKEARERLDRLHTVDWMVRHSHLSKSQADDELRICNTLNGTSVPRDSGPPNSEVSPVGLRPPLVRLVCTGVDLKVGPPTFSLDHLPQFLFDHGKGLPFDTNFSLLVPMHLQFVMTSLHVSIRDYPLPLLSLPNKSQSPGINFSTNLVIAEEMGTANSVDWIECPVVQQSSGSAGWGIYIPKTIMPVKNYANPVIRVKTTEVTSFSWGASYAPAIQDIMRVLDSLSTAPRDSSPGLGFWDKIRLVFHWTATVSFTGEVRLHVKGSRDPYCVQGHGAGFVLSCRGYPRMSVHMPNPDKELLQVTSETMVIAIPRIAQVLDASTSVFTVDTSLDFLKVCATIKSGVRFGIGFELERTCDTTCTSCSGAPFYRKCRRFHFVPHHTVKLELKDEPPALNTPMDTFRHFRANFVHLSISLASGINQGVNKNTYSSIHMSPKTFAHFWAWWRMFDSELSLPIRQGSYYPARVQSPKLGRHIGTIKYRFSLPRIFLFHAYIANSRAAWSAGVTTVVGAKARIGNLVADLHQREQELTVPGISKGTWKTIRRKPFYAAELVLDDLEIRTVAASCSNPLKKAVHLSDEGTQTDNLEEHLARLPLNVPSTWVDADDFVELDWVPTTMPSVLLLPVVSCPFFTYLRHNVSRADSKSEKTKFGSEDTHTCLLGKQSTVSCIQTDLARQRIEHLSKAGTNDSHSRKIVLLQQYIQVLEQQAQAQASARPSNDRAQTSYMTMDLAAGEEASNFDNVYQIHNAQVFLDRSVRDVMLQYYRSSQARRGFEYHLATRAIKFIREQAANHMETALPRDSEELKATSMLRKLWVPDTKESVQTLGDAFSEDSLDPLQGWLKSDVSLQKSHFCVLLKPQVILRTEDFTCVLAAVRSQLRSFSILDKANINDPISGRIMSRNYTTVTGLQAFSPTGSPKQSDAHLGVPLEVLIDLNCESVDFDRIVPQTDAQIHYDKFNHLRLRNNLSALDSTHTKSTAILHDHLQNQADLIKVHVPRLTVIANDSNFQTISHVVTRLLLFSDPVHKTRLEKLRTMLFMYDFTDIESAATVIGDVQARLRAAIETESNIESQVINAATETTQVGLLKLKAHIYLLSEELGMLFDAIQLAQDQSEGRTDHRSALLLHVTACDLSWRMIDVEQGTLAKLAVKNVVYDWLNKQDSSMTNQLIVADLQVFDGSPDSLWPEILCKHMDPANHPLLKKGQFINASWSVLAPVGGISIFADFELSFHPLRLQIDGRMGTRIMEYVWPARRQRHEAKSLGIGRRSEETRAGSAVSASMDLARPREDGDHQLAPPAMLRRLGASRSFTDLRSSGQESLELPTTKRTRSITSLRAATSSHSTVANAGRRKAGDAAEMATRSSQKSFVRVKISSVHLLLSVSKEGSFECRDARIRTRDLEFRNQTWSFEELVNQFIPSDMGWRGWVKVAFHQPLIPVLPVARELFSKTKLIAASKSQSRPSTPPPAFTTESSTSNGPFLKKRFKPERSATTEVEPKKRGLFSRPSSRARGSIEAPDIHGDADMHMRRSLD